MAKIQHLASLVTLYILLNVVLAVDRTLEDKSTGRDVVDAVCAKIRRILSDDSQLLSRIAYVETKEGTANGTFAAGKYGGIWNVNQFFYTQTKKAILANQHNAIQMAFNISWANTTWEDLLKPLYSGLAARLYIDSLRLAIPQKLEDQADFWYTYYNSHDDWTVEHFVNQTKEYQDSRVPCEGKMDLVAIFDRSGSIGQDNFQKCRQFLADFFGQFRIGPARLGLVTFSTGANVEFGLDNYKTVEEIKNYVLNLSYPGGWTNTNAGLRYAATVFNVSEPRSTVPRIATIFTDGGSNQPQGVDNIKQLEALGVLSFAIGITSDLNMTELYTLANNIPTNVYTLNDFDVLTEFSGRLIEETCKERQKLRLSEPIVDVLSQRQRRYYALPVPAKGLTLEFKHTEGSVTGYWSRTERNPSSAIYDGLLEVKLGTFIPPAVANGRDGDDMLYVTVEGVKESNNYTIEAVQGNSASTTPTTTTTTTKPPPTTTPDSGAALGSSFFGILFFSVVTIFYANFSKTEF